MEQQLVRCADTCLRDGTRNDDALFYAAVLYDEFPRCARALALHLRALMALGKHERALSLFETHTRTRAATAPPDSEARRLAAQCCLVARRPLQGVQLLLDGHAQPTAARIAALDAPTLLVLGKLLLQRNDGDAGAELCLRRCLLLDPTMWTAYTLLCGMGVVTDEFRRAAFAAPPRAAPTPSPPSLSSSSSSSSSASTTPDEQQHPDPRKKLCFNDTPPAMAASDPFLTPPSRQAPAPRPPSARQHLHPQSQQQQEELGAVASALPAELVDRSFASYMNPYASVLWLQSTFRCDEALRQLASERFAGSQWAQAQRARALFERGEYEEAARVYAEVHRAAPHAVDGLELYSTALWHLRRPVELTQLARDLVAVDRLSAAAWCAMGNCFSLRGERTAALRLFARAAQLDPRCAYAYALAGHELAAAGEAESAQHCFALALGADRRQYSAWLGMGGLLLRREQYAQAAAEFQSALAIHPTNTHALTYLALCLHRLGRLDDALRTVTQAVALCPANHFAKVRRAEILLARGDHAAAAAELRALTRVVPEAALSPLLAQLCAAQGRAREAWHWRCVAADIQSGAAPSAPALRALTETLLLGPKSSPAASSASASRDDEHDAFPGGAGIYEGDVAATDEDEAGATAPTPLSPSSANTSFGSDVGGGDGDDSSTSFLVRRASALGSTDLSVSASASFSFSRMDTFPRTEL